MDTTNSSENQKRRVEDRKPSETIDWEAPGAPAVPQSIAHPIGQLSPTGSDGTIGESRPSTGAPSLTNDQIAAGAAVLCDHGTPIGRNAAIDVFDAMSKAGPGPASTSGDAPVDGHSWPAEIWLQHGCGEVPNYAELHGEGITWCADHIDQYDIKYVRADLARIESAAAPAPDWFNYDESRDTLTIHGIKYSGELMRDFGRHMPQGQLFELVVRQGDGALCIKRIEPATASGDELPPLPVAMVRIEQDDDSTWGEIQDEAWAEDGSTELMINAPLFTTGQMQGYARAAVSAATKPTTEQIADVIEHLLGDGTMDWQPSESGDPEDTFDSNDAEHRALVDAVNTALAAKRAATKPTADLSGLKPNAPLVYAPVQAAAYRHGYKDAIRDVQSLLATKPAAAPAVPTDEQIVAALHSCGIDTRPSKYGFDAMQIDGASVPGLREVFVKLLATPAASTTGAAQTAEQVRDQALEDAAKVCHEKFLARSLSGHPREASAARNLVDEIRALKRPTPTHSSEAGDVE